MNPAFQLYVAIRLNDVPKALQLLESYPAIFQDRTLGQTPLHYAAANGNEELISTLIRLGADVHAMVEDSPMTPLDTAAMYGNTRAFQLLLDAGAKLVQTTPECGGTLIGAVNSGSVEIVRQLLDLGANPHTVFGPYRSNALRQAIKSGHTEVAELLRAKGCQLPE